MHAPFRAFFSLLSRNDGAQARRELKKYDKGSQDYNHELFI